MKWYIIQTKHLVSFASLLPLCGYWAAHATVNGSLPVHLSDRVYTNEFLGSLPLGWPSLQDCVKNTASTSFTLAFIGHHTSCEKQRNIIVTVSRQHE